MGLVGFTNLNNSNYSSKKRKMAYIVLVKYFPEDLDVLDVRVFQPAFHLDGGGKKIE